MGLILIILGGVVCGIGGIWLLVEAFKTSMLWGLAYLFIPFAALVFVFTHWQESKKPFLINVAGMVVLIAGIALSPDSMAGMR